FHPAGVVYRGRVTAAASTPWPDVADRLSGHLLVRLSSAWWKRREWPDVLGVAVRFTRREQPSEAPTADDQDLLFATTPRPWTLPFAPLTTKVHDFFANDYYGVSPFAVDGIGRALVRLVPAAHAPFDGDRPAKLAHAVAEDAARWHLEVRPEGARDWSPLAELRLTANVTAQLDQKRLRYSPFRAARGFTPVGFVQGLRRATYAASQEARPHADAATTAPREPLRA
ncbi:MAG TPA: hypothetical protein VHB97_05060, partial [Polyangia bacterium]|nr:hypothetical protein [Polyangia bacterium]